MKRFPDEHFLLYTPAAVKLFTEYSRDLPVIDYHCHLNPEDIYKDRQFKNITEAWLEGDHYKWRAMRANGISEEYCTGNAPDRDKFLKWAETVPMTLRNPLYHWTHLELQRYFNIEMLLNKETASEVYDRASEMLSRKEYSVRNLLRMMKVEVLCTTDDPADSLEWHHKLRQEGFEIKVLPTWRADKVMMIENPSEYIHYLKRLAESAAVKINSLEDLLTALRKRQEFFAENGCRLSDHGLEKFYAEDFNLNEVKAIFNQVLSGKQPGEKESMVFKSAMLHYLAEMDHSLGWTQQFHIGALRNNNRKMYEKLGPDKGYDSIADHNMAREMSKFLDRLEYNGKLAKTILYNLNPGDNEMFATMCGNFNDGIIEGKMQFGSGWWFLDQKEGMERQMNALSALGLLSHFVGMLTDSRSFLSYPRHEYFRRILCNLIGTDMERGEIPYDFDLAGDLVKKVSYYNAKNFFGF